MGALPAATQGVPAHSSIDLEVLFKQCFYKDYQTLLMGGADEPLYRPATAASEPHRIYYRADYFASALHEIAHWCIAGAERRRQEDWGYWYCPDGRSPEQQRAFEAVEVVPQAIEWMFSVAADTVFRLSSDNLLAEGKLVADDGGFPHAVSAQVLNYRQGALPLRAQQFLSALAAFYGVMDPLAEEHYREFEA